ncbi:MAG: putative nucleotidyltransferase [Crocinitomix sp.]|jgi:predicted nucleotidyltransferase
MMTEKILHYINKIEKEREIKILLACETGSRAWGFPSPDSDFDVRIIYVHKKDWYLSLSDKKDSVELMFENNDIDITGWDLRKSLKLLQKSNASIIERIQSPILYKSDPEFLGKINELANSHYSKIATMHHYLSMAKKFIHELKENEEYKLKKFFYALRSAVACKWILVKAEMPPIEFQKMLDELDIDPKLLKRINELIALKATISEAYLHIGEFELFEFIDACINAADEQRNTLPSSKGNMDELNTFFLKTISDNDN